MAVLKNQARLKCNRCGSYYTLAQLETTQPDPDSEMLMTLVRHISDRGMCPDCYARHTHHANQKLMGVQPDYHQIPTTTNTPLPKGPMRVTCEYCGTGNHPMRNTCRKCKRSLPQNQTRDARGKLIHG